MDFGFNAPFVCLWVHATGDGVVHVIDEYIQPMRTLEEHLDHLTRRRWPATKVVACDPAGNGRE